MFRILMIVRLSFSESVWCIVSARPRIGSNDIVRLGDSSVVMGCDVAGKSSNVDDEELRLLE